VLQVVDVMRSKSSVGEYFEGSYQEGKMSKVLMKLRLQKNINRQIQKENYELRMQLQALEEEKQRLQDRLLCHEEFHKGIFHEFERKLQIRNQVLAPSVPIHEDWQGENVKSPMQKGLPLSKKHDRER
jgi:hypothetical protein